MFAKILLEKKHAKYEIMLTLDEIGREKVDFRDILSNLWRNVPLTWLISLPLNTSIFFLTYVSMVYN